jgi:hypothetical protein
MQTIAQRDALREKTAKAHARQSMRVGLLTADREKSGLLMVQTRQKRSYNERTQISSDGICRHDMPAKVCSLCRELIAYKSESRYVTIAKRKLGAGVEASAIKETGWRGTPQGAPSKLAKQRQVAIRQPSRLPIGEEVPESKPVLIAVRITDGGTRKSARTKAEAVQADALQHRSNYRGLMARNPRYVIDRVSGGQYCPLPRVE